MKLALPSRRAAHTLIELMVSMGAGSVLVAGLASCIFVAGGAFNGDDTAPVQQAESADALRQVVDDLRHATSFQQRTATAASFTVPDRDGDGAPERIRYAWSGTPGDPLTMEYNGSAAKPIVADVQNFDLDYLTRFVNGVGTASLAPKNFGNEDIFADASDNIANSQRATRVELTEAAILKSISVYAGSRAAALRVAIYADDAGEPGALLAESLNAATTAAWSWVTVAVPDTVLAPGFYWLAFSFAHPKQAARFGSGGEVRSVSHAAVANGFIDPWGVSQDSGSTQGSIYATYFPTD